MISSIDTVLDAGQNLAGVTKSYVDLSIKTDATTLDRQAGLYGYLGVLGSVGQVVFDKLNQPGFASIARNLGGGAALAGMAVSFVQFQEAKAAWDADPSTTTLNVVLEKAAGLSANMGGVIAVLPRHRVRSPILHCPQGCTKLRPWSDPFASNTLARCITSRPAVTGASRLRRTTLTGRSFLTL